MDLQKCLQQKKSAVLSSAEKTDGLQLKAGLLGAVDLKSAGNFVILSKTGITSVYKSTITGNIGTSPITGAAMVVNCGEVLGSVFSVDAAGPASMQDNKCYYVNRSRRRYAGKEYFLADIWCHYFGNNQSF